MKWFLSLNCFHFQCWHLILADLYSYWEQLREAGVFSLKNEQIKYLFKDIGIIELVNIWEGKEQEEWEDAVPSSISLVKNTRI